MKKNVKSFKQFVNEQMGYGASPRDRKEWRPGGILNHRLDNPLRMSDDQLMELGIDPSGTRYADALEADYDKIVELDQIMLQAIEESGQADLTTSDPDYPTSIADLMSDLGIAPKIRLSEDLTSFDILEVWEVTNITYPDEHAILGDKFEGFRPIRNIRLPRWFGEMIDRMRD
jgi:hypothetical protein